MPRSDYLFLPLAAVFLLVSYGRDKGQHRLIKLVHAVFMLILVGVYCDSWWSLAVALRHPIETYRAVVEIETPLPSTYFFPLWGITLIANCYALVVALAAARRRPDSAKKLVTLIPFLMILGPFGFLVSDPKYYSDGLALVISAVFAIVFFIIPYGTMFFFYRSTKVRTALFELPEPHPDAEPEPEPEPEPVAEAESNK